MLTAQFMVQAFLRRMLRECRSAEFVPTSCAVRLVSASQARDGMLGNPVQRGIVLNVRHEK